MISEIREQIYNYFHDNPDCQAFFFDQMREERYAAYYTSMYLLQDTTESLAVHRENGFSENPFKAYIEFWGVMQAVIIQQDTIRELYETITGSRLKIDDSSSWSELRYLRNICAGHPAKRNRPKSKPLTRTFMRRDFGGYSLLTYEKWEKPKSTGPSVSPFANISHPEVELGNLMDEYEIEVCEILYKIYNFMESEWPST